MQKILRKIKNIARIGAPKTPGAATKLPATISAFPSHDRPAFFGQREFEDTPHPTVFVSGSGRCGTHFLAEIFYRDENYYSLHSDHIYPAGDAFYRYVKFHDLPVDYGGLFWSRRCLVDEATKQGKRYIEVNPLICLNVVDLTKAFNAKLIVMVRNPLQVIASILSKNVYSRYVHIDDFTKAAGFQYNTLDVSHPFSVLIPSGDQYEDWSRLSVVGKTAWYWRHVYQTILTEKADLPSECVRVLRLEDLDYEGYLELGDFTLISPVSRDVFNEIVEVRPGRAVNQDGLLPHNSWSEVERREALDIVGDLAAQFGYDTEKELFG